jgi:Skp family chaperone for outer membrane proteins
MCIRDSRYAAEGGASSLSDDLKQYALALELPGIRPPSLKDVFSSDSLKIRFTGEDNTVKTSGSTTVHLNINDKTLDFSADVFFNKKAGPKDKKITFSGRTSGRVVEIVSYGELKTESFALDGSLDGSGQWNLALTGAGKLHGKDISLKVEGDFAKDQQKKLAVTIAGAVKAGDLLQQADLPGLRAVEVTEIKITKKWLSGTARIRDERTSLLLFKAEQAPKPLCVALIHDVLKFSNYVPQAKGTMLDDASVKNAVFVMVRQPVTLKADEMPEPLKDALSAAMGSAETLDLRPDVNFYANLEADKPGTVKLLMAKVGLQDLKNLRLKGRLNKSIFDDAAAKAVAARDAFLDGLDIGAKLPAFHPPVLPSDITFKNASFAIKGVGQANKRVLKVAIAAGIDVTLKGKALSFDGLLELAKEGPLRDQGALDLAVSGQSSLNWEKPLGIEGLTLQNIGFAAAYVTDEKKQRGLKLALTSKGMINRDQVDVSGELSVEQGRVKDVAFKVKGTVNVSSLPHVSKVPGINEFAFRDLEISPQILAGELTWKTKNVTAASVIYAPAEDRDRVMLIFRLKNVSLDKLVPKVKGTPLEGLSIPEYVVCVSTKDVTKEMSGMPEAVKRILAGIIDDPRYRFKVEDGVTVLASFDPRRAGGTLKGSMQKLGVQDPIVISGAVGGVFGGMPSVALYAKLPRMPLPQNLPKFINFAKSAQGSLFMKLSTAGDVAIGFSAGIQAKMGDDLLDFATDFSLQASAVGVGLGIAGRMDGTWNNPLGLKGLSLTDTLLKVTVEADSSVGVVISGVSTVDGKRYKLQTLANVNVASLGVPKEIIFNFEADEIGVQSYLAFADIAFKSVAANNAVRNRLVAGLPDQNARNAANAMLQQVAGGKSLSQILKVDQLPLVSFKKVKIYLATPGASDPDLQIEGMGAALKGDMFFQNRTVAKVDSYVKLTGLKVFGQWNIRDLGPVKIDEAKVDIAANLSEPPHFIVRGKVNLFGTVHAANVTFAKEGAVLYFEDRFGELGRYSFTAKSVGRDLLNMTDFTFQGEMANDFNTWFEKRVGNEVQKMFSLQGAELNKVRADLTAAENKVKQLDGEIARAREQARREINKLSSPLDAAQNRLNSINREISDLENRKSKMSKLNPGRVALSGTIEGLKKSRAVAEKAVAAARATTRVIPIDAHPDVAPKIAAREIALVSLRAAKAAVSAAQGINNEVSQTAAKLIRGAGGAQVLVTRKAAFSGGLRAVVVERRAAKLSLDLIVLGRPLKTDLDLPMYKPTDLNVAAVADAVIDAITDKKEHSVETHLARIPEVHGDDGGTVRTDQILARTSNLYLDVSGESKNNGAKVLQWTANNKDNQLWTLIPTSGGYGRIMSKNSGKVLSVEGGNGREGTKVVQWDINNQAYQEWKVEPVDGAWFQLVNRGTGKCLDVPGGSKNRGTELHQWGCQRTNRNQMFKWD